MSRIGKVPVAIPAKVKVEISGRTVLVEGPKGKLSWTLPKQITCKIDGANVSFERSVEDRKVRALHGLSRALVNNMITGVNDGFVKDLEIQGVGFKAAVQGKTLKLNLGFSHDINFPIPEGIKITVVDNTKVKVEGIDKHLVGQVAANMRALRKPDPYKNKGVRYTGEKLRKKVGKAAGSK